ncbi:hypothetical protein [Brevibacterium casei]
MSDRLTTHQRREILAHRPSETDTVSSFCRDHHISRDSYYRIKNESQPLAPASTAPKNPHTHLEFYLVPHGELIATIDLPLSKQRHLNVIKIGRFVNGDRGHLPSGVESLRKTHPVSEK